MESCSNFCVLNILECATDIIKTRKFTNWIVPPLLHITADAISKNLILNPHLFLFLNHTAEPIYTALLARSLYNKNVQAISIILQHWPWEELRLNCTVEFDYMAMNRMAGFTMDSVRSVLISLAGVYIEAIQYQRLQSLCVVDISSARRYNVQWPMLIARMVTTSTVQPDAEIDDFNSRKDYLLKVGEAFPLTTEYKILHEIVFSKPLFTKMEEKCIGVLNVSMLINSSLLENYTNSKITGRSMLSLHVHRQNQLEDTLKLLPTFEHISDEVVLRFVDLTNQFGNFLNIIPRRLTKLSLNQVWLGVSDLKAIHESIHKVTLQKLELTVNLKMTDSEIDQNSYETELIRLLEHLPSLEVLVLKKCVIPAQLGTVFFQTLVKHCRKLALLDIFFCRLPPQTLLEAGCLGSLPNFSVFCIDLPHTPTYKSVAQTLQKTMRQSRNALFADVPYLRYPNLDAAFWKEDYFEI